MFITFTKTLDRPEIICPGFRGRRLPQRPKLTPLLNNRIIGDFPADHARKYKLVI